MLSLTRSLSPLPCLFPSLSQRVHLALSLRSAMSIFFKIKNYNTCATFCRRLLELQPDEKVGLWGLQRWQAGKVVLGAVLTQRRACCVPV